MNRRVFSFVALALLAATALLTQGVAAAPATMSGETVAGHPEIYCESDPCPGWGTYQVSCTANQSCSASATSVTCDGVVFACPDECATNGICNPNCKKFRHDDDCPPVPMCDDGKPCTSVEDCADGWCAFQDPKAISGICIC